MEGRVRKTLGMLAMSSKCETEGGNCEGIETETDGGWLTD
jgi:hypothetical protein